MSMRGPLAGAAAVAAYGLLSHGLMLHAPGAPWAAAVILGPIVLGLVGTALARRDVLSLAGCGAALALIAGALALGGAENVQRLYVLQYVGINVAMCTVFASTLRKGSTALITRLAAHVHRDFTPALQAYTRRLTALWAAYFVVMAVASVALFAWAPWSWWSLFANLVTPAAVVALFAGEQVFRHLRHPEFERASITDAWRAWHAHARQEHAAKAGRGPR
ncbi:MAG: hypothetical protein Q8K96_05045 [Rubrivivax sp.]|nr:hypothetical protein [Rubrivivax sp.]